jgi:hypothetical protein
MAVNKIHGFCFIELRIVLRVRRRAPKIGASIFQNTYGHGANVVTAGQKDYQMRMMQIEKQHEDYYRKLGTPLGAPKMKGATVDPENTHESYNTIIKGLGGHCVPAGWIQRPKRNIALRQEKNANGLIQLYMVSIMNTNAKACGMCT